VTVRHREWHRTDRIGWLRAAVFGANDGIVSTASLVLGVAAAHGTHSNVMVAGIAGVAAGAMSMAAGEYVSVRSQADSEQAALGMERTELKAGDKAEHQELAAIYVHTAVWIPRWRNELPTNSWPMTRWARMRATNLASPKRPGRGRFRLLLPPRPASLLGQACRCYQSWVDAVGCESRHSIHHQRWLAPLSRHDVNRSRRVTQWLPAGFDMDEVASFASPDGARMAVAFPASPGPPPVAEIRVYFRPRKWAVDESRADEAGVRGPGIGAQLLMPIASVLRTWVHGPLERRR
jgi:hypothetical protein